jgi:hypothetical protein
LQHDHGDAQQEALGHDHGRIREEQVVEHEDGDAYGQRHGRLQDVSHERHPSSP